MFGSRLVRRDERQIDVGFHHGGKLALGLFAGFLEPLQGHPILAQVDTLVLSKFVGEVVDDALVEVFAAEERIAVGRLDLKYAFAKFENRNVKSTAAEIEDCDL